MNPFSFVDSDGVQEADGLVARVVLQSSILHAFFLLGDGNRLRLAKYSEIEDELENLENACKVDLYFELRAYRLGIPNRMLMGGGGRGYSVVVGRGVDPREWLAVVWEIRAGWRNPF